MGLLTTITFANDNFHDFRADPKGTMQKISDAMMGQQLDGHSGMKSHKPIHTGDEAILVCMGGTVINLSSSEEMERLEKQNPFFFNKVKEAVKKFAKEL